LIRRELFLPSSLVLTNFLFHRSALPPIEFGLSLAPIPVSDSAHRVDDSLRLANGLDTLGL
jgi:hypothetical protein